MRERVAGQSVLLPLVVGDTLPGGLDFDGTLESVEATETTRRLMCTLRDQLVAAFAKYRAAGRQDKVAEAA